REFRDPAPCSHPLQPSFEYLDAQAISRRTRIALPQVSQWDGDPVVVPLRSGVAAEAFFLVVDRRRLDDRLDHPELTTDVMRDAVMADRKPHRDANALAGREGRSLTVGFHDRRE